MAYRLGNSYNVAIATTSTRSAAPVPNGVLALRLSSSANCFVEIGGAPVATLTGSTLINSQNKGEIFVISPGEQVAVIATAAGGALNVTELTS